MGGVYIYIYIYIFWGGGSGKEAMIARMARTARDGKDGKNGKLHLLPKMRIWRRVSPRDPRCCIFQTALWSFQIHIQKLFCIYFGSSDFGSNLVLEE